MKPPAGPGELSLDECCPCRDLRGGCGHCKCGWPEDAGADVCAWLGHAAHADSPDHDWRRQMEAYGYDSVDTVGKMIDAARREGRESALRIVERRADAAGIRGHELRHPNGQKKRSVTISARKAKSVELALRQAAHEIRESAAGEKEEA